MDFRLSEEQEMIATTMREAIAGLCPMGDLRAMMRAGRGFDADRWAALADLGLCAMLVPEEAGGLGLSEVEMVQVAEAAGAGLLPEPLIESAGVAVPLLAELGVDVGDLVAGRGYAVLAHPAQPLVAHAAGAARVVLCTQEGGVVVAAPADMSIIAQPAADPLVPLFDVAQGAECDGIADAGAADDAVARAVARGQLFAAAQMLGIAGQAVTLAIAYACERHQFGRPIGANQAIKHMLAEAQVGIEFLRPVVQAAAGFLAQDHPDAGAHVAHARLRAADVVEHATRVAIQVHGAMGYSWEADAHLYLKRGMILAQSFGAREALLDRVAARAFADDIGPGAILGRRGRSVVDPDQPSA